MVTEKQTEEKRAECAVTGDVDLKESVIYHLFAIYSRTTLLLDESVHVEIHKLGLIKYTFIDTVLFKAVSSYFLSSDFQLMIIPNEWSS